MEGNSGTALLVVVFDTSFSVVPLQLGVVRVKIVLTTKLALPHHNFVLVTNQ